MKFSLSAVISFCSFVCLFVDLVLPMFDFSLLHISMSPDSLFTRNEDLHRKPLLDTLQNSRDHCNEATIDTLSLQLLHQYLREHCKKGCRKTFKRQTTRMSTV